MSYSLKMGQGLEHFSKDVQIANKHMKRCLTSLVTREIQNESMMRYHFTSIRMAITKKTHNNKCWSGGEEIRCSYTVGENVNVGEKVKRCSCIGKLSGSISNG